MFAYLYARLERNVPGGFHKFSNFAAAGPRNPSFRYNPSLGFVLTAVGYRSASQICIRGLMSPLKRIAARDHQPRVNIFYSSPRASYIPFTNVHQHSSGLCHSLRLRLLSSTRAPVFLFFRLFYFLLTSPVNLSISGPTINPA